MHLDACDRLFSLHAASSSTPPVGEIRGCLRGLRSRSMFFFLFYSTAGVPPRSGRYVGNKITKQYVDEFHFTEEVRANCLAQCLAPPTPPFSGLCFAGVNCFFGLLQPQSCRCIAPASCGSASALSERSAALHSKAQDQTKISLLLSIFSPLHRKNGSKIKLP